MEKKFTKGEWLINNEDKADICVYSSNCQSRIATISTEQAKPKKTEILPNAKLIAASPDLLEALEDLIFTCEKLWNETKEVKQFEGIALITHPTIEKAKEAIAKALS